ncbi:hypothetical protein BKA65DRAFT_389159, partial [Rhexocercosporidium sp. MPI-PUGE-AT-0058]
ILPKLNKLNYFIPKVYKIITFLNCLSKISERIIAKRLNFLAEIINLLYNS